jgi:hypothetical protein
LQSLALVDEPLDAGERTEEKTRTATPAASKGADDVGNPNSFVMRALRPPGNVAARRRVFDPGPRHVPKAGRLLCMSSSERWGGPGSGLQCMSFQPSSSERWRGPVSGLQCMSFKPNGGSTRDPCPNSPLRRFSRHASWTAKNSRRQRALRVAPTCYSGLNLG